MTSPSWISVYGVKFYPNEYVHCGWQDNDLPQFAKIQDIIVVEEHPVLYVQKFQTIGIHSHLLAYQLSCMYSHTLLMVSSLYNKNTFSAHTFIGDGKLYITVKNNDVVNMLI